MVESIERYEAAALTPERPKGRDWYVRAEEKGGDGSKDKPFRDPYQALEKANAGDVIHVTAGEYGGKLKNGKWIVDKPWITLLGGYDGSSQRVIRGRDRRSCNGRPIPKPPGKVI